MKLTYIASPLRGSTPLRVERNKGYARAACAHSSSLGESPYAPHLLLTQWLDDDIAEERAAGMAAGKAVLDRCDIFAMYTDLGTSGGMQAELAAAQCAIDRRCVPATFLRKHLADVASDMIRDKRLNTRPPRMVSEDYLAGVGGSLLVASICPLTEEDDDIWYRRGHFATTPRGICPFYFI